jgi:mycofactocin glycosyltransferase
MPGGELAVRVPDERRQPVPVGTRLRPDRSFEWIADTLVSGGSPWRLVRLTEQGAGLVARWLEGTPVSEDPRDGPLARRLVDAGMLHPWTGSRRVLRGDVDVVVPVRDDLVGLESVLRALTTSNLDVVVVDDGSSDAAAIARIAASHEATLVRREVPGGPAAARNSGARATTAPFVAFLDADAIPPEGWLEALLGQFDDPLVALVGPRVRGPKGTTPKERFESVASPLDLGEQPGIARPGAAVPYLPSAALVVRRAAFGEGFDETFRVGEDVDLCWRLSAEGWLVRYEPSIVVTHAARSTWPRWIGQRVRYGTSAAELEARHGDAAAPLRADPRVLATLALALGGRPRAALGFLSWSASSLAKQLEGISVRGGSESAARQLALRGTALAAPGLSRSTFRSYGPILVAAAVALPPLRRPVATLALAATATRWWRAGRPAPRLAFVALSVADDLCYGSGVLVGAVRARRLGALRPRLGPGTTTVAPISRT